MKNKLFAKKYYLCTTKKRRSNDYCLLFVVSLIRLYNCELCTMNYAL